MLKKAITICAISLLCLILAPPAGAATVNATADVNLNTTYQQIEGFGGSICYDMQTLTSYPTREAVYDLLFKDLGLDILRIKNTYQINSGDVNATAQIVEAGKLRNPALKTLLVPWSPKASLKSDGTLGGVNGTLKKDANDSNNSAPYYYVYNEYAKWWLNSLTDPSVGFNRQGVYPDYISIQNEPDWGYQDQVCRFATTEGSTYAGYDRAFEAVHNKLDGNTSPMPKMLAPESAGLVASQSFITALNSRGQIGNIYGFSHHLYDCNFYRPDDIISAMQSYKTNYADHYKKPSFMTEYGGEDTPTFQHAMLLAQHIYNSLVYEGATSYVHWILIRNGGYTTGGVINLVPGGSYIIRDLYWFIKHYAFFTDPGWFRAKATTTSSDLRITAFRDITDTNTAIVILNTSATNDVSLTLSLAGFDSPLLWTVNEIYRSTSSSHWVSVGPFFSNQAMLIPAQSITTIHLTGLHTCADVQNYGYSLGSSDLNGPADLNGDCYVDFDDLKIIADNWLRNDCSELLNNWCNLADWTMSGSVDFADFSGFAPQWMQCNNPQDANCTPNWK